MCGGRNQLHTMAEQNLLEFPGMEISVVLATYNRAASLQTTLATFAEQKVPSGFSWELLIVDNNSTDSTPDMVARFAQSVDFPVRYIFEKRQGRSYALNTGIAEAKGGVIAFTDDDVLLHKTWLMNVCRVFRESDCTALAGRVLPLWSQPKPDWLEMDGQYAIVNFDLGEDPKYIKIAPLGANCAFRRAVFEKYGDFRLDLGVRGSKHTITCDDTEFGERLIQGNEQILYCPDAVIYHPVDLERATKKYFLRWYYYNGVSVMRTFGVPLEGARWFGVPRWLYREFLHNTRKWLFELEPRRRFHHKLRVYRNLGNIVESYRLSHRQERHSEGLRAPA